MRSDHRYGDMDDDRARRPGAGSGISPGVSVILLVVGILLGLGVFWAGGRFLSHGKDGLTNPDAKPRETSEAEPLDSEEREAVNLFKKVKPSVVNVDLVMLRRLNWDDKPAEYQTSTGSGFIWDDEGRIVTNFHVVADQLSRPNLSVRIVMSDRSAYDAAIVGVAPDYDLAVLQFAPQKRPPSDKIKKIDVGSSHSLEVGQKVFAIGNPYDLRLTMTKGIISALDRVIESPAKTPIPGIIQVDAAINPGNSGGPLLDKSGHLIGVNTAIASATGGNVGIGFAIPADTVNQVATEIIKTGRILRPDLGIKLFDQRKLRQARFDRGVMVDNATPNGPADKAGIRGIHRNPTTKEIEPGDLIVALNGVAIDTVEDYEQAVRKLRPGDKVILKIVRKDVEQDVTLTVGGS